MQKKKKVYAAKFRNVTLCFLNMILYCVLMLQFLMIKENTYEISAVSSTKKLVLFLSLKEG